MLKFLDCYKDATEWDTVVGTTDPHYSSAYYRCFAGGTLVMSSDGTAVQPFHHQGNDWIGNAYNYGGPLAIGPSELDQFSAEFDQWKEQQGLNERCTLMPVDVDPRWFNPHRVVTVKEIVYVNLKEPLKLRQTTRHAIEKAKGVGVNTSQTGVYSAPVFSGMYHKAMKAKGAAAHWHYQDDFFRRVLDQLGPDRSALFLTWDRLGTLLGGCLLIFNETFCYYHWAARSSSSMVEGAGQFQMWTIINWAKERGCAGLTLGGGLSPNPESDGLMVFKAGFSDDRLQVGGYQTLAKARSVA